MAPHSLKPIPYLKYAMHLAGATNISLGAAAGVSYNTIQRAKDGVGINPVLANSVMQAVCERTYARLKPGRKP